MAAACAGDLTTFEGLSILVVFALLMAFIFWRITR